MHIAPDDAGESKEGSGKIPAKIDNDDNKKTFDGSRPTVIEVVGIGTVTFDKDATKKIAENAAGADNIFFEVKDVTPSGKQEVVYQVLMKKATDQGVDVFSKDNAAGEVTMEIPLGNDVADVTKVTLLDGSDNPIDGGVVYGSVIYDSGNKIVTFKVNYFSKCAVGYVLQSDYKPVTSVSIANTLELDNGAVKTLKATIAPENATNKNVIWSSSDTTKVKVDKNGKVKAVALGTATITVTTMNLGKTATCEVTVVTPKPFVEIAAKYNGSTTTTLRWYRQSLAITASGKKAWKDGNGSAVKVPGTNDDVIVGDYFPWGTFAGFYGSGADSDKGLLPYSAFTNTGCGDGSDGFTFKDGRQFSDANVPYRSDTGYTKYNAADGRTTLEASDDVASIVLGGTWRMPTQAEFQAMKQATYWAWDATDKGYYVYAPNPATDAGKVNNGTGTYDKVDALLFFPAAGFGGGAKLDKAGSYGRYWSSTFNSNSNSFYLLFYASSVSLQYDSRYNGFSVRPVQDPTAKYEAVTKVSLDLSEANFEEGDTLRMSATVSPAEATQNGVYWTSSDTTKVTVDATGTVIAKAVGTATIQVTTVDGGKTATCTVTVKGTKSMAKILKTNSGIPESQDLTPPTNAWLNSTDKTCKAFIGIDGGKKYFVIKKEGSTSWLGMSMDDVFEKIDGNTYQMVSSGVGTFTVKMTGGKFTSYKFEAASGSDYAALNGTYSAPVSVTFVNADTDITANNMPSQQVILSGNKATKPSNPNDNTPGNSGFHTLEGWYKTKDPVTGELSDKWDFNNVVTEDITLYAQWQTTIEKIIGKAASGADEFPFAPNKDDELHKCEYVKDAKTWTAPDDANGTDKMFFGLWLYDVNTDAYTAKGICVRAKKKDGGTRSSSTYYERNVLKTKDTYKYKGGLGTYTFTIENGVFNKLEFEATDPNSLDATCNGTYTHPTSTTTGTAKRTGDIDVKWIQLWENGPKFAEYNVGVTDGKAESYGGYYCWGKTVDQDENGDYKTGTDALTGDDDTATNLWGSNWRMPTADELGKRDGSLNYVDGLLGKCTVEWIDGITKKYNDTDAKGLLCTGKGDYASNSVFLPAAGDCFGTTFHDQGTFGYYWSSTPDGSDNAYYLIIRSDYPGPGVHPYPRYDGYSVRAVLAE